MEKIFNFSLGVVVLVLWSLILSLPTAFALMLFLGNIGVHLGFLGAVPGGFAIRQLQLATQNKNTSV